MDKKIWRCIRKNFLAVAMVAIFIFSGVQGCRVEAAAKPKLNKKVLCCTWRRAKS